MCAVHSQPVKGRVASLAPCDVAFIVSSALCHLSVLLAFRTDHIQAKQTAEHMKTIPGGSTRNDK